MVLCGNKAHFYEKHGRNKAPDDWDVQKIDLGIALCHFALAAQESGLDISFALADPGIAVPADTTYIASYEIL